MEKLNKVIEEKLRIYFGNHYEISNEFRDFIYSINDEFNRAESEITNLYKSEEKYRSIYENAVEGIFQSYESGKFITVNPALAKMLKYDSPEDLLSRVKDIGLLFSNSEQKEKVIFALSKKGSILGLEVCILCKDNTKIWVNVNIRRIYSKSNELLYYEGCVIDITDRKFMEEVITESENRFRALIENGSDLITLLEKDGRIRFESPSAQRLLGDANIGKNILDIIHPDDIEKFNNIWENCLLNPGSSSSMELRFLSIDNSWRVFEIFIQNMLHQQYVEGFVLNSRDITERIKFEEELKYARNELEKRVVERTSELTNVNESLRNEIYERTKAEHELIRAKEEAEKADNVKTEFLAQVSHEIRTPINVILNYSSLIRFELEQLSREDLTQLFNSVERASSRLMRTIDLIVNMAQIQTQSFKPSFKKLDVFKIINQLANEYIHIAKTIGVELYLKKETENTILMADEYTISQVFLNLIDNAVKYTREGYIEIRIYSDNESISIDIKDTGIGIASEFIPKLFTPFVQEETGYTRRYEGNGLGLAIVKTYVELNNGQISVQSEKGKGSLFTVCFAVGKTITVS